ncbi:MAG: hypothetical protein WAR77_11310 [Saprospiraceae bacterium]
MGADIILPKLNYNFYISFKTFYILACFILFYSYLNAQISNLDSLQIIQTNSKDLKKKLHLSGYGVMNLNCYNWQLFPAKRNDIDFERAVLELNYQIDDQWKLVSELEIEHGGTGVTLEFDPLEEFGEFEYEVEKGGEIWLEQFNIRYHFNTDVNVSFGRVKVPFGLSNFFDEPDEYRTNQLPEMENVILPTNWTEYGILLNGIFRKHLHWYLGVVAGLDGSAFNSANFIKRGNQRRFETVNAEDIAGVIRLDYKFNDNNHLGISGYFGNTRNNRPKPDLQQNAFLALFEAHTALKWNLFSVQIISLFGQLQNSEAVSNANRNLSNNLNVKRTPVGKQAFGASLEFGFQVSELIKKGMKNKLFMFGRYDYYDTQFATEGSIFNNPRWERNAIAFGFNYLPTHWLILKGQYSKQIIGIAVNKYQETMSLGFGFIL